MSRSFRRSLFTGYVLLVPLCAGCGDKPKTTGGNGQPAPAVKPNTPPTEKPAVDKPADPAQSPDTKPAGSNATVSITKAPFGATDGKDVSLFTITNANGLVLKMTDYGAAIVALETPDKNGKLANVNLGFDTLEGFVNHGAHFGCTIGRYGNRIAKGKFKIDDKEYQLPSINNGENHLHGGKKGFDRLVWTAKEVKTDTSAGVEFKYLSPDGDEGYPGALETTVTYTLNNDNELKIEYRATTDKPTVVNLTNHAYWNLAGAGSGDVLKTELTIFADQYLDVGPGLIPTGEFRDVKGTPLDFTTPVAIGRRIAALKNEEAKGYDHCYVLRNQDTKKLAPAAKAKDPESGRVMEISTTEPGIQLYTGNHLSPGGNNGNHVQHGAFCLETQHYPDSPNQPKFPSTVLRPGETYHTITVHKFSVEK